MTIVPSLSFILEMCIIMRPVCLGEASGTRRRFWAKVGNSKMPKGTIRKFWEDWLGKSRKAHWRWMNNLYKLESSQDL